MLPDLYCESGAVIDRLRLCSFLLLGDNMLIGGNDAMGMSRRERLAGDEK